MSCVTPQHYIYKGGMRGEVVKETSKKNNNRRTFMTSHMTLARQCLSDHILLKHRYLNNEKNAMYKNNPPIKTLFCICQKNVPLS